MTTKVPSRQITSGSSTSGQVLTSDGAGGASYTSRGFTTLSPVTAASSVYHDFSISGSPKQLIVMLAGASGSGTSPLLLQLGDSGGVETSGYLGASGYTQDNSVSKTAAFGAGFNLNGDEVSSASATLCGAVTLTNLTGNTWVASLGLGHAIGTPVLGGGYKTLSDTLTTLRVTTANGTDTIDAGTLSVLAVY